ncbi:MAG: tetratricopeptide repeat protein [Acidobacteriaceae bacterium]|nr:tetratricopeptide repeat protein [Acidobacteriaceae bacterium]
MPNIKGLHAACAEIYRETDHADWAAVEEAREAQIPKPDCASHPMACAFEAQDWMRTIAGVGQGRTAESLYWATLVTAKLAEQSFERLTQLPSSSEVHEILAESYQRAGHRMDAIEEWRKALAMQPNDQRVQGRLAESLVRARMYGEAGKLLALLVAAQPGNPEWQYFFGKVLFEQGLLNEALPHLAISVRSLPSYLPAQEALGRVYLALGQPGEAVPCLERALPLNDDGSISFALSVAYRRLNRPAQSQAALLRYRKLSHDRGEATSRANPNSIPPP